MRGTALKIATAAGLVTGLATGAAAQQKNVTIGVSIPAATHGWTGGVVYHAQETAKLLEKGYPGLKMIVKTSPCRKGPLSRIQRTLGSLPSLLNSLRVPSVEALSKIRSRSKPNERW